MLAAKLDARRFCELAEQHRATHAMLVPVRCRIIALRGSDRIDLRSFRSKTCTSAPGPAALKADVVARGGADGAAILAWTNARLGRTQRLTALHAIAELPRNTIGKVLKRELRDWLDDQS